MTEIAKELNLKSAKELNKILADDKIQYKINGTWVLCSDYSTPNQELQSDCLILLKVN